MKSSPPLLSIGEAAARFGLPAHVLRHWESMGLLSPARAEGDRRRYGPDDLVRIAVIMRAKEAAFGLDEIREIMTAPGGPERREILRRHREALERRIAEARASLHLIECALDCPHDDFVTCPTFQGEMRRRVGGMPAGV